MVNSYIINLILFHKYQFNRVRYHILEYVTTERPQNHLKYNFPTKSRRISTTVAPFIVYESSTALPFIQRRKPEKQGIFQKVSPAPKHYRTFVDYEYYDDDDVRYIGKAPMKGKVYVHPSGK